MRECIKVFANVIAADLGMKLQYGQIHGIEGNKFLRLMKHVHLRTYQTEKLYRDFLQTR